MLKLPNMAKDVTFEPEEHIYRMGTMIIPSVSNIISPLHDFSAINASVLENAANRGKEVHYAVEKFLRYGYMSNLDNECQPFFEQFVAWFKKNNYDPENFACEVIGHEPVYNFCGTIDIIMFDKKAGIYRIIDLKTGSVATIKPWKIQISAYALIAKRYGIVCKNNIILHLSPDGYNELTCDNQDGIFFSCLTIYNYINN